MFNWLYSIIATLPTAVRMIIYIVSLAGGVFALVKGADLFVDGASGIATRLGVSALIIGITIVSVGTSLPETSVSVVSAIYGNADISLGNVIGSNVFNVLVVLGVSAVISPIAINRTATKRDLPVCLGSGLLLILFCVTIGSNQIIRIEGIIFLIAFITYLVSMVVLEKRAIKKGILTSPKDHAVISCVNSKNETVNATHSANDTVDETVSVTHSASDTVDETVNATHSASDTLGKNETCNNPPTKKDGKHVAILILLLVVGATLIILGGEFVTYGAKSFALQVGMSEVLVGLTIVAVGTSLPELVTSVVAGKKGEKDIAFGNAIGSCTFNVLFILGMASTIVPLSVSRAIIIDCIFMCVIFAGVLVYALIKKSLTRPCAIVMLSLYAVYLTYIILRDFVFA